MSTYLYLECRDHHPHVSSDGEVGQHLYDLPDIRKAIAHRDLLIAVGKAGFEVDFVHHFVNNTVRFLCQHPNCTIAIRDEYGNDHPVVEAPPVDPRVAVVQGAVSSRSRNRLFLTRMLRDFSRLSGFLSTHGAEEQR